MSLFVELKENKTGLVEGVMFYNGKARVPKLKAQELIEKGLVWCEALGEVEKKVKVKDKVKGKKVKK
ncbi:MAG: hypothetical protein PHC43_00835 [Candidatus Marinimicrobia bacterium]|nr:hypothetical protein [Candidatus Neomarinimicrobiota bacterium]MDD5229853.1 hypothetical protein [Candidatus Neomarinimicrobiota bacterium]MDD5539501.1 hypothetical protein [Candidatus Neomarinimicrobiota bacterium]